ncbi:MAG: tetratricopeptide repeat protein, partial [Planctomycetes bacterium]|nr:tetratricopeptide repeat protein [Planctomycetota bacterium]
MKRLSISLALLFVIGLTGCQSSEYHDIGDVHRDVSAASSEAQLWFDRGLAMTYGFNHEEAIICFDRALAISPDCAMAHWGRAYALGPNYNAPILTDDASHQAFESMQRAVATSRSASPVEQALIQALQARYSWPAPADRSELDRRFADEMRKVHARFPDDAGVCAATAEALMQLRPWKLWSPEGKPAPELAEIRRVLEGGLKRWPDHPALCHLYIHAMEAGPEVALAVPAARRLEPLTPGLGHLVHMPSHIYVWTGQYDDVIRVNLKACEVDDAYVQERGKNNFYTAYRIHNYHFVAYGAMWEGRRELALRFAKAIPGEIDPELLSAFPEV